jgi:hypothetical protein
MNDSASMQLGQESGSWPEVKFVYDPAIRDSYYAGKQFGLWVEKYKANYLFCERMRGSREIPNGVRRPGHTYYFNEFFAGIQYLAAGYEAMVFYRQVEDQKCYQKIVELLGGDAAAQVLAPNSEKGGRAPDLVVFDPQTGKFRFVECKKKNERYTPPQKDRFLGIERYLNNSRQAGKLLSNPRREDLFPPLALGQWIHVARLMPSKREP